MQWSEYLEELTEQRTVLDDMSVSLDRDETFFITPSIIKASILLNSSAAKEGGIHNIILFPDGHLCPSVFSVMQVLFNISEDRIQKTYNPHSFVKGEKLKYKNCVMEFDCIENTESDRTERIWVKFVDLRYGLPLSIAPYLQHVDSKRLSQYSAFKNVYSPSEALNKKTTADFIPALSDYKTHLGSTSVIVAPIAKTRELLLKCSIDGTMISDFLLLGYIDPDGNIKNMTAGQLQGNPAIVLCSDLYAVTTAIIKGANIHSIFFLITGSQDIEKQLDAIDDIKNRKIPMLFAGNLSNEDYMSSLISRGFGICSWNPDTIKPCLLDDNNSQINIKNKNCANHKIEYSIIDGDEIGCVIALLNSYRKTIEEKPLDIITVFNILFDISFVLLRTVIPCNKVWLEKSIIKLNDCKKMLVKEKAYISTKMFCDFNEIIDRLMKICSGSEHMPKIDVLSAFIQESGIKCAYIITQKNSDLTLMAGYLNEITNGCEDKKSFSFVSADEYLSIPVSEFDYTIIPGWLNSSLMDRIFNSSLTPSIHVFLYNTENRWKSAYDNKKRYLSKEKSDGRNKLISFVKGKAGSEKIEIHDDTNIPDVIEEDELDVIELVLKQNNYRRYASGAGDNQVEAIPVNYIGDYLAFYRPGRKLLTATKLICEDYDRIEEITPDKISIGDFVVERETERSLIREIADTILSNSGLSDCRVIARKWKEALEVESIFCEEGQIVEKLRTAGCNRGRVTIHNWLNDDDVITPQMKDDIIYIARAFNDPVLLEMVDQVYDAGTRIKSAHIKAGHYLSDKLKKSIASFLQTHDEIDIYNVWEPIDIVLEDVGAIKILKVIDISPEVLIELSNTNRLIDTNRVDYQGG